MLYPGCFDGDLEGCPGRPQLQQGDPHQGRDLLRDGAVRAGGVVSWPKYSALIGPDAAYCGHVGCDWSAGGNTHFLLVEQAMVQHYRGMKISPRFENNVFPSQIE